MGHDTAGAEQPFRRFALVGSMLSTRRGRFRRKMEPQITQSTQRDASALQVQDDAVDREARLAEIEQQAEMQARRFQIVQALCPMNLIDPRRRLQFGQNVTLNEQVNRIVPDRDPIVSNTHAMLP